jgi:hypothetical protein
MVAQGHGGSIIVISSVHAAFASRTRFPTTPPRRASTTWRGPRPANSPRTTSA